MRRYRGFIADNARWERFAFRPDDVIISTPSKCGTTWMQNIVGMLVLGRIDLGAPISSLSPWLDMLIRTDEEVFQVLERQRHRRFIKTHTPLDGEVTVGAPSRTRRRRTRFRCASQTSWRSSMDSASSGRTSSGSPGAEGSASASANTRRNVCVRS